VIIRIGWLVALLALNAFFVAAEFAMVRARRTRLVTMARGGDVLARMALRATRDLNSLLSVCQLGITLCSLALGWVAESALVDALSAWIETLPLLGTLAARVTIASVVALTAVTFFTVVFGELVPKTAALRHPESWARFIAPPILLAEWVLRPFTWFLNHSANLVLRLAGQRTVATGSETVLSSEELRLLVEQSQEGGALPSQDADLIDAVFEFSEKNAREVMTPRTEIIALDVTATLDEVVQTVAESGRTRFPVYEETIDDIIGILLAKDLIRVLANPPADFSLRTLIRPPHFVPGTREVEDVLADFKRRKEHLAIVLDEYGGTAGIVTMEDLLEEIVGEILDEYDKPEEAAVHTTTGEMLIPGATNISELNEEYGTSVPDDDYTTLGGYVFGAIGRLPKVGDSVTAGGATFTVRAMDGRKIETLAMEFTPNAPSDSAPQA
jgi:CBS domain containing-hemolysin-like protein